MKAFILSSADRDPKRDQMGSALLAAVAHDPKLLKLARDDFRRRLTEVVQSGLNFKRAAAKYVLVFTFCWARLGGLALSLAGVKR